MVETVPRSKPEHELMRETTAGSQLGVTILNTPETTTLLPGTLLNHRNRTLIASFLLVPIVGIFVAIADYAHTDSEQWMLMAIAAGIILTIAFVIYLIVRQRAMMLGPLLIYEKSEGSIVLPRESRRFPRNQIEHLQVLTVPGTGNQRLMTFTEINLITKSPSGRARWAVLGSIENPSHIEHELEQLISETDVPVFRYLARKKQGVHFMEVANLRAS